jgi:hypothetical protein
MTNFDHPEFACSNCTAIMIVVRRNLLDFSPIVCSRCGTFIGTFGDLQKSTVDETDDEEALDPS